MIEKYPEILPEEIEKGYKLHGCVLEASISENVDKASLEEAYGQFKTEARQLNPNYQPL
jgi:hypothetical protein